MTDLSEVLTHYGERLLSASPEAASRALGNMAEVRQFHSECLCPELERCGANPAAVARVFVASCPRMKALYSSYCQNMDTARQAIQVRTALLTITSCISLTSDITKFSSL